MHNLLLYYLWAKHSFPSAGTIASHLTHILQCTHWWSLETHTIPSQRCCQQVWFWSHSDRTVILLPRTNCTKSSNQKPSLLEKNTVIKLQSPSGDFSVWKSCFTTTLAKGNVPFLFFFTWNRKCYSIQSTWNVINSYIGTLNHRVQSINNILFCDRLQIKDSLWKSYWNLPK